MSLQIKARSSLLWTAFESLFVKAFSLLVIIGLTRLLQPSDFGLMGLIAVFINLANVVVESGMGNSIIRDNNADNVDFSTVFWGNLCLALLIYPIIYFTAPFIAEYYQQTKLTLLLRVYGLSILISSFISIQQSLLMKELEFKKLTLLTLPGVILGSLVGILLAYLGFGVWSIVAMHLSTQLIKVVVVWFKSGWLPQWIFSVEKLKGHLNFGYKLTLSSILNTFINETYSLVIGKMFSISILGYYNQAKTFKNQPIQIITTVVTKATYPVLSKIKEETLKIAKVYQGILKAIFFLVTPLMYSLVLVARPLFTVLFSEKWLPAVPYFQILAFASILTPIHAFNINVFKIYGRTDLFLRLGIVKFVLVLGAIYIGSFYGIYGLLWGSAATYFIGLFINTHYSGRLIQYTTLEQLKDIAPIIGIGCLSILVTYYFVFELVENLNRIFQIVVKSVFFNALYFGISYLGKNKSMYEAFHYLSIIIKKK